MSPVQAADERGSRELAGPSLASHTALVVTNGRAGGAGAAALRRGITILERGYHVRVATPGTHAELVDLVAHASEALVVAVGGDGTVNAVVSALPAGAALAVMPLGTANDFACELGVPRDAAAAAELLVAQRDAPARRADLLRVGGLPFCTVGGIGLVTRTTATVLAAKERPGAARTTAQLLGGAIYKLAAASAILAGRDLVEEVVIDYLEPSGSRGTWSGPLHALFAVNHRRCGGGLVLPTPSSGGDGVFELGIVTASSRPALVGNFLRLSSGAPIAAHAFVVLRATEAVVRVRRPVAFAADGELLATGDEFRLTIDPGALRLLGTA